jgi:hypothetical protein
MSRSRAPRAPKDEPTAQPETSEDDKAEADRVRALSETSAMKALIGEDPDRLLEITLDKMDDAADDAERSEQSRSWLGRMLSLLLHARPRTRP